MWFILQMYFLNLYSAFITHKSDGAKSDHKSDIKLRKSDIKSHKSDQKSDGAKYGE